MGERDKWAMKLLVAAGALLSAGAPGAQEATQKTVKEWQTKRPERFVKRVYDQAGLDT